MRVEGVYVLSVKTFTERIAHIRREMERHGIAFTLVLEHDVPDLDAALVRATFAASELLPQHQSLVLKHIAAWRSAQSKAQRRVLVFEDDAVLAQDFAPRFDAAMRAAEALEPGWLVNLGGADAKVPDRYFLEPGPLIRLPIGTTEAYVTDLEAVTRRLAWLESNKVTLPADHFLAELDPTLGIEQYWLRPPLVEQGSSTGLFDSALDRSRGKHSRAFNALRNRWSKFQRRRLRAWLVRARATLVGR
jgi:glycosyl transferase family 25